MDVYLSDYRSLFVGDDATLAVQEALRACREHPGSVLHLGGGTLSFYKTYAFEKEYYISNNDYSKKSIVFPLIGMRDLTVDGEGADLLFHGPILPFVIDQSENVTLKNFTVDYPYPFFFQARITAVTDDFIDLTMDKTHFNASIENNAFRFTSPDGWVFRSDKPLVCEFDDATHAPSAYLPPYFACLRKEKSNSFLEGMFRYLSAEQVADDVIRLSGDFKGRHTVGAWWVCTFCDRCNPGIFGSRSKNIRIENVTLYSTASMGVICQLCENVTMDHLATVVREGSGRLLSVNADSTHFVNCSGTVKYESCTFLNMLDDAGNCHGNYLKIHKVLDDHSLLLTYGHPQQRGINLYDPGDKVYVVNNRTMQPVKEMTVASSEQLSGAYLRLTLQEPLPALEEGYAIENFTKMPELIINNCVSGFNRPRGFLLSTWRKTTVTNCTFFNMSCALHLTGDCNDWFESGHNEDVLIKNNHFTNAAYTGGPVIGITPNVKEGAAPYHKNIMIEDNDFTLAEKRFLWADHTENLVFRNNKYIEDPSLPKHGATGESGVGFSASCVNCFAEEVLV